MQFNRSIGLLLAVSAFGVGCADADVEGEIATELAQVATNFRLSIQFVDHGTSVAGTAKSTGLAGLGSFFTPWTSDSNGFDPDGARIEVEVPRLDEVLANDFRLCMLGADHGPGKDVGPKQCTPWASQGGGRAPMATDSNALDPDYYQIGIETRTWPAKAGRLRDFRVGIQGVDHGGAEVGGTERFTPWAAEGGGWSEWASDSNFFDPDGYILNLDVRFR